PTTTRTGEPRVISKQMLYTETTKDGVPRHLHYPPYLDFRPLAEDEPTAPEILDSPACAWITRDLEREALAYAIEKVVPEHLAEVRTRRLELIEKTRAAVRERLTKEISYWDHRAEELRLAEEAGKSKSRLNSTEARKRADELHARLQKRMAQLDLEAQISARPPVALGGFVVVPIGLIAKLTGRPLPDTARH